MIEDRVAVTEGAVRAEVRAWLQANWAPHLSLTAWRSRLVEAGWATPSWDRRWHGRGLPAWADGVVGEALREIGAVGLPTGVGTGLAAPTILTHGSDRVRARYLRPILTGEETWCQLFSEPGAGSDLAGLTTTAVLDGDRWTVSGQKVWNTSAQHADLGLLVARTDWNVPKHQGLTYLIVPMRQAGVEVRPLRQMNDHSSFNQVWFTEAEVPHDNVIGEVGGGWTAALTTLAHERRFGSITGTSIPAGDGSTLEEARREAAGHFETYRWYPQRGGRPDLAVAHARAVGRTADPVVRNGVAGLLALKRAGSLTAERARVARALGQPPGAEGSIGKLALSRVARHAAAVHSHIGGAKGMLTGGDDSLDGIIAEVLISVPGQSIAGGTDEIQHNILGEKVLGLPREPSPDRALPFCEVHRNH